MNTLFLLNSEIAAETASILEMAQLVRENGIRHVAIIMDGNRRWAQERHLPKVAGHGQGVQSLKQIVTHANDIGLEVLTVYAFSTENWQRDQDEVGALMKLFLQALGRELDTLHQKGVRLKFIGDLTAFPTELRDLLHHAMEKTVGNAGIIFQVAVNYGSRAEITRAVQLLAQQVQAGLLDPAEVTEERVSAMLYTAGLPDPDLLIRTSGEYRISNYLLWQCAYAELYITSVFWPSFTPVEFNRAVVHLIQRNRRYGC